MGRRAPRPLALAVNAVREGAAPATPLGRLQAVWPETAGQAIAAAAEPTAEREGIVTVSCTSAVWANELELLSAELLERIRERLGEAAPRGLKFVVAGAR